MKTGLGGKHLGVFFVSLFGFGLLLVSRSSSSAERVLESSRRDQAQPATTIPAINIGYTGPSSCMQSLCQGNVKPFSATRIRGDEYTIWLSEDKHSEAFKVLSGTLSKRITRNLGLPDALSAALCLDCHALNPPPEVRGRTFEIEEGVSCESCHGPAAGWLGPHTTKGWTHQQSLERGMYDTKDLIKRTERCLSCHLGSEERFVDHEMIAAGHPDLVFELDTFSDCMPRHWEDPEDPNLRARTWGVGQAVQWGEALRHLTRRAQGKGWPEYADLQCEACHHNLTPPQQSWRQEMGYPLRRPGIPPWNVSRYAAFRHLVYLIDPQMGQKMENQVNELAELMHRPNSNRPAVSSLVSRLADLSEVMARQIVEQNFDQARTLALLGRISEDADRLSGLGARAAEQAVMALESLFIAYTNYGKVENEEELRGAIGHLIRRSEKSCSSPSSYLSNFDPIQFADGLRKVHELLSIPRADRTGKREFTGDEASSTTQDE